MTVQTEIDQEQKRQQLEAEILSDIRGWIQLMSAAGIPCADFDIERNRLTMWEIAFEIMEDVERSHPGQKALEVVSRMTLREKAELRTRVDKANFYAR